MTTTGDSGGPPRQRPRPPGPGWVVEVLGDDPVRRRVVEALLTVADGRIGTRGTRAEDGPGSDPFVMAAGVYHDAPAGPHPLPGPLWFGAELATDSTAERRWLDLRTGVLHRQPLEPPGLHAQRFACLARPGTQVQRITASSTLAAGDPLVPPSALPEGVDVRRWEVGDVALLQIAGGGGITAAAATTTTTSRQATVVERVAVLHGDAAEAPAAAPVLADLEVARHLGVDQLLAEQRDAWAARWEDAHVAIDGDPELELAVRFGLFHMMASVADRGEAAVGARGLTGPAYAGHVFWDADVFVLPFLAATHPTASRAMLEYRNRRLGAARQRARQEGHGGARFPWESAADGTEATPTSRHSLDGATVPIRTGQQEVHIIADVAWAAWQHALWSGDDTFLTGLGRPLLLETAAYWASRIEVDPDGSAHVRGVIGPDEYHEDVDDNAYTNVMAGWNLRHAAALAETPGTRTGPAGPEAADPVLWRRVADALVTGRRPGRDHHEQFAGYDDLEPLRIDEVATPPVAADVLLGAEHVQRTQIIKQADVLMLHHLVPDELPAGTLLLDLDHYLPRTAHGSSLSPGVHASLLARAGRPEEALRLLRLAARLDLDDVTGTTAGGLHLATMGSVWQALAFGFLGVRPHRTALHLDPRPLPASWRQLELRVLFHGRRVALRLDHDRLDVDADAPVPIVVAQHGPQVLTTPLKLVQRRDHWHPEVQHAT